MRALVWTDAMIDLALGVEFLQRLPDPVLIVRDDDRICFANPAAQALAGWTNTSAERPIEDLIRNWKSLDLAAADQRLTTQIDCGDGGPIPVELSTTTWRTDGTHFQAVVIRRLGGDEATNERLDDEKAKSALALAQTAQKRLEQVVEMLPQAVCMFDAQDRFVLWNRRYAELYPEIAAHLRVGIPFADILRLSLEGGEAPEKIDDNERWLVERLAKHARPSSREEQEWRDGRWILHDDRRLSDGGAIGMRIDITDLKRREASFRLLFQSNPVPMLLFERGTLRIIDVNDAAISVYGFPRDTFLARSLPDLHETAERSLAADTFSALRDMYDGRTVWRHCTARNDPLDVLIFVRASQYNDRPCFLTAIVDVSDRIRAETQIAHMARHDPLTGLANRIRLREMAEAALSAKSERPGRLAAVHCLDLDGFKPVNDAFGHLAGDDLLRLVGERLRAVARRGDLVARLGGDEFAILQTSGLRAVDKIARRFLSVFEAPFRIANAEVQIGASLGFAIAPQDGASLDELLAAADVALYAAKAAGRNTWRAAGAAAPRRAKPIGAPLYRLRLRAS